MESRHSANKGNPYFSRSQISLNPTLPSLPIPALYLKIEMHPTTQLASSIDGKNTPIWSNKLSVSICVHLWLIVLGSPR